MENTIDLMQKSAGYGSKPTAAKPTTVRTIAVILITLAGYFATRFLGKSISGLLGAADSDYKKQFIVNIPIFIFLLVTITFIMKKKKVLTSNGNGFWGGLITGGYELFASALLLISMFWLDDENDIGHFGMPSGLTFGAEQVWVILAILLSAGICEELMFRGIILNALRDCFGKDTFKGTVWAIVISGIMFGCMHFINLTAGVPLKSVLIQVIAVCGGGIFYGAVYCRWGNIKVTIFLHFLQDICVILPMSMQSGAGLAESVENVTSLAQLSGLVIYCAIAAFLLRKKVRHQLFTYDLDETLAAA